MYFTYIRTYVKYMYVRTHADNAYITYTYIDTYVRTNHTELIRRCAALTFLLWSSPVSMRYLRASLVRVDDTAAPMKNLPSRR